MKTELLLLLVAVTLSMSCKKEVYNLNDTVTVDFEKSELISLGNGDIEINYLDLVEDSRCPPGLTCIWAGQVAVKLLINNNKEIILGFHKDYETSSTYGDYTITLLAVRYTKDKKFGAKKKSCVEVKVEKG